MLELPVDVIGLDFVWGRANWDALKAVSFKKKLGLGVVDARNTRLETARGRGRRDQARRASSSRQERLYVNPSCGLEYVPRETAFEKLKVLAQGARLGEGVPA